LECFVRPELARMFASSLVTLPIAGVSKNESTTHNKEERMDSFKVESVRIKTTPEESLSIHFRSKNLPQWTHAFQRVLNGRDPEFR